MDKLELNREVALRDFLLEQEKICKISKAFKLHFTFEALRFALSEAETNLELDLDWVWENLYEALKSKSDTATDNYILGLFIWCLTQHGARPESTIKAVADWMGLADRTCGSSFQEIRKLEKAEESGFWFGLSLMGKSELISFIRDQEGKKNFPEDREEILHAFMKLKESLLSDENKDVPLPIGSLGIKAQYAVNKEEAE